MYGFRRWKWAIKKSVASRTLGGVGFEGLVVLFASYLLENGYPWIAMLITSFILFINFGRACYFYSVMEIVPLNQNTREPPVWVGHRDAFATLFADMPSSTLLFEGRDRLHAFLFDDDILVVSYEQVTYGELAAIIAQCDKENHPRSSWVRRLKLDDSRRGTIDMDSVLSLEPPKQKYQPQN